MWESTRQLQSQTRTERYLMFQDGVPVLYRDALQHWQHDQNFRYYFITLLAGSNFNAYRWETPPVSAITADRDFEFILQDAPELDQPPEEQPFAQQFAQACPNRRVVTFENLGKDATLIVPCPTGPGAAYAHLAAFIRSGPPTQVHELWQAVGAAMTAKLSPDPIWLSTAGAGVAWLHVRLDTRPKYYSFAEYRNAAP
jgi:hypothetical protein